MLPRVVFGLPGFEETYAFLMFLKGSLSRRPYLISDKGRSFGVQAGVREKVSGLGFSLQRFWLRAHYKDSIGPQGLYKGLQQQFHELTIGFCILSWFYGSCLGFVGPYVEPSWNPILIMSAPT